MLTEFEAKTENEGRTPGADLGTVADIRQLVALAAKFLAASGDRFLSATVSGPEFQLLEFVGWDACFHPRWVDAVAVDHVLPGARLVPIAGAVLADLASRFPSYATPPRFGFVTDGHGLGLSAEDPDPLAQGWLDRVATGFTHIQPLMPFAPKSPLALIAFSGTRQ